MKPSKFQINDRVRYLEFGIGTVLKIINRSTYMGQVLYGIEPLHDNYNYIVAFDNQKWLLEMTSNYLRGTVDKPEYFNEL